MRCSYLLTLYSKVALTLNQLQYKVIYNSFSLHEAKVLFFMIFASENEDYF